MRLNKHTTRIATEELLGLLRQYPQGLTTSQLIGTPRFHGMRTLTARQVARLLRATSVVHHCYDGAGYMAASRWTCGEPEQRP